MNNFNANIEEKDNKEDENNTESSLFSKKNIFSLLLIIIMGIVGGSSATYVGVTELIGNKVPLSVHIGWALMPIMYWVFLYNEGPKRIFNFLKKVKNGQYASKKSLLSFIYGTTGFVLCFGVGYGISVGVNGHVNISVADYWTIICASVVCGCVIAGKGYCRALNDQDPSTSPVMPQ
jgi:hypothetical protein